jgi:hypothetical protein
MREYCIMNTIKGIDALGLMNDVSKMQDGCFTIAFFPYSRAKGEASADLIVKKGCKVRTQLPEDRWSVDSDNYFLFTDGDGKPQTCYRILIRFVGFPNDNFELHKINWYDN